ncbi:putative E3 ubiquitin-protein ligase CIP8-like [Capsicum annuum]|nr:putative E3 ubiquitin-protein ligase CIP8-like [Capsicum annuum]
MADKVGLEKNKVSKHDLNMITVNRPHQGLILDASLLEMVAIKELKPISIKEQETTSLWVALDEVTDPQNLGTIIRAAYLLGASGIVLFAKNCVPLSGVVRKASVGSLKLMELRSCKNIMQFLASSIENGWRILGSEGTELRLLVERLDTELVKIPRNIPFNIVVGQDEDAECDNSISGQNYRSVEIKDLVDLGDSDNVSNFKPRTNVPGTSGAAIHSA